MEQKWAEWALLARKSSWAKESRRQQFEGQASAHSNVQGQGPPGICKSPSLTGLIKRRMCPVFLSFPVRSGHQHLSRRAILKVNWMAVAEPPGPGRHLDYLLFRCPELWQLQRRGWIRRTPSRRGSAASNPGRNPLAGKRHPMDSSLQTQTQTDEALLAKVGARRFVYLIGFNLHSV